MPAPGHTFAARLDQAQFLSTIMKVIGGILCICFCLAVMQSLTGPPRPDAGVEPAIHFFKEQSKVFAVSAAQLQLAIAAIRTSDPGTIANARMALRDCRLAYKKIEFFLEYFFTS